MARDSGKFATYRSEWSMSAEFGNGKQFSSKEEIERYIKYVSGLKWYVKRFGTNHKYSITVRKGGGGVAYPYAKYISIDKNSMHELLVLHEMCHCVLPSGIGHGPAFRRTLILFVEKRVGKEAAQKLRKSFIDRNLSLIGQIQPWEK